jgi:hypothetical protein
MWCAYGKQPINMQLPKIGVEDVLKYIAIVKQIWYPQLELGVLLSISCSPGGAGCPGSGGFLGVLDHIGFGFPVSMFVSKGCFWWSKKHWGSQNWLVVSLWFMIIFLKW